MTVEAPQTSARKMSLSLPTPPSATSGTASPRAPRLADRLQLRHPGRGLEPGPAAGARADPDLDGVDPEVGEERRPLAGGDVAARSAGRREAVAERLHRLRHDLGVAVGDVDHQAVGPGLDQRRGALEEVAARADRGADQQPPPRVLARERRAEEEESCG